MSGALRKWRLKRETKKLQKQGNSSQETVSTAAASVYSFQTQASLDPSTEAESAKKNVTATQGSLVHRPREDSITPPTAMPWRPENVSEPRSHHVAGSRELVERTSSAHPPVSYKQLPMQREPAREREEIASSASSVPSAQISEIARREPSYTQGYREQPSHLNLSFASAGSLPSPPLAHPQPTPAVSDSGRAEESTLHTNKPTTLLARPKEGLSKTEAVNVLKSISVPLAAPEPQLPAQCVVFCVDLSFSLSDEQTAMAKKAYKTILKALRTRNMDTYMSVIVQNTSVSQIRYMDKLRGSDDYLLDRYEEEGQENYDVAFTLMQSSVSRFWSLRPGAPARIILIGDGHAETGYDIYNVYKFRDQGVAIHNIRVASGFSKIKDKTIPMSIHTNGENIVYRGREDVLLTETLLGPMVAIAMAAPEPEAKIEPKDAEPSQRQAMFA